MKYLDITGQVFGRLTAIERTGGRPRGGAIWRFRCECGAITEKDGANVRNGRTTSCGCALAENHKRGLRTRHGMSRQTVHNIWNGMRQRCENPNSKAYPLYGGRGIKVCPRWGVFENFLADMGIPPHGASLDRIDGDGDYEPGNCRWADAKTQSRNRGVVVTYTFDGKTLTLAEWGEKIGVPRQTMWHRYKIGKRDHALLAPLRVTSRTKASA